MRLEAVLVKLKVDDSMKNTEPECGMLRETENNTIVSTPEG